GAGEVALVDGGAGGARRPEEAQLARRLVALAEQPEDLATRKSGGSDDGDGQALHARALSSRDGRAPGVPSRDSRPTPPPPPPGPPCGIRPQGPRRRPARCDRRPPGVRASSGTA